MMQKQFLLVLAFLGCFSFAMAQLPINRDFQQAFEKGTRSLDGAPGARYWQNRSDYKIEANFDPATGMLQGSETITYYNNSPDSLERLVIRLYQDIFKKGNARDEEVSPQHIHEGVKIGRLRVNGNEVDMKGDPGIPWYMRRNQPFYRNGTLALLRLEAPVAPGATASIEIDWSFPMPSSPASRMGKYGAASYFVPYWYPQIAVFDDVDGWDTYDFGGTLEMYNDFGNFEVALTVPDSLLVWATGVLQNPEEVLAEETLARFRKAQTSDEVVRIVGKEDYEKGGYLEANGYGNNTWRFKAEYVPDFAFAVSDSFFWDGCSVVVDSSTGRRTFVDVGYRPDADHYDEAAEVARLVVHDLSFNMPGVPFPYPCISIFNGAGGMEFPMLVNDGRVRSRRGLLGLTHHEFAHTYFPFFMGINERKYAWMDEGWANFLPLSLEKKEYPDNGGSVSGDARGYARIANTSGELPLMAPTYMNVGAGYGSYGIHAYSKPAVMYATLYDLLGEESFKKALQLYISRWNGKHPIPYDFFFSFNQGSGQNLDWFWEPWCFETAAPDLSLSGVSVKGGSAKVTVVNEGGLPVPVWLTFIFEDGSTQSLHWNAAVWKEGGAYFYKGKFEKEIVRIVLGSPEIPDVNPVNNEWERKE